MRPTCSLAWRAKSSDAERPRASGPCDPLLRALLQPDALIGLDKATWLALLTRARQGGLLRRLAAVSHEGGICDRLPEAVQRRFAVERLLVERNRTDIGFEVYCVQRALEGIDEPLILLKGAAYLAADLPLGRHRACSDLDLMVPKVRLGAVERALLAAGWQRAQVTPYDDRYYRSWMHELPPLFHPERGITVDLHHTIHPPTGRYAPNSDALVEAAAPIGNTRLRALCPADMVLHCGLHLFTEEITTGLSDLMDVHELLQHFGKDEEFWDLLLARTRLHGLERILYYMVRYTGLVLGAAIPPRVAHAAERGSPPAALRMLMDLLFRSALMPADPARRQPGRAVAVWLLYVRSHWLRMPLLLLAPHLCRKALSGGRAAGAA
jgi:hypothetical protein